MRKGHIFQITISKGGARLYARVVRAGRIRVGDPLLLLEGDSSGDLYLET